MRKRKSNFLESRHRSLHHIVPTSKGGPREEWNEYQWRAKEHRAWHSLFHNYLPSTCINIIKDWTNEQGNLLEYKMGKKGLKDWRTLFNDWTPKKVIEYIEEKFIPAEILFRSLVE